MPVARVLKWHESGKIRETSHKNEICLVFDDTYYVVILQLMNVYLKYSSYKLQVNLRMLNKLPILLIPFLNLNLFNLGDSNSAHAPMTEFRRIF